MNKKQQAVVLLEKLKNNHPEKCFGHFDFTQKGVGFVLIYLLEHSGETYAKNIAEVAGISRARMAVLINKMIAQGLIEKTESKSDKRIEVLHITRDGENYIKTMQNHATKKMVQAIDLIGFDEMNNFVETAVKISKICKS